MTEKFLKIIFSFLFFVFSLTGISFAEFSISVRPYEGGYDLDFGKIGFVNTALNKEVTVNINSSTGKQYRLIQTIYEPLTNSQGISLPSRGNFTVYAIRGSNKTGTISVEQETPVNLNRTIIYTSNSQGLSDSFTLVYSLAGPFEVPPGGYRGRIGFTLESVDGTQPPVSVFLNILAQIDVESAIEVTTSDGSKFINLDLSSGKAVTQDVIFNIKGDFGKQFKIYQFISGDLKSPEGEALSAGNLKFSLSQISKGTGPNQPIPVLNIQQLVYTSGQYGEAEGFVLNYSLAEGITQKAGRYRGNIKYFLESLSNPGQLKNLGTLTLEVNVEKIFDLKFTTENGSNAVLFRGLKPNDPTRTYEVNVEVQTNIGRKYQVTQKVLSELANREGKVIDPKYFMARAEADKDVKGVVKLSSKIPVVKQDTVLFISDKKGSADKFKVIYELSAPWDTQAGDYSASIVYSLTEL